MAKLQHAIDSAHNRGWPDRIGRIIMNSSAVELESVHWLVQLTERHEDIGRFFGQTFMARLLDIERCVEIRGAAEKAWRQKALRAWNEVRVLIPVRNQVAHNPLIYGWSGPAQRGEPDFVCIASMPGRRSRRSMLKRQEADKAGDDFAALAQRLTALRREWQAKRDQGMVPPAMPPTGIRRRLTARFHRWIDKLSM